MAIAKLFTRKRNKVICKKTLVGWVVRSKRKVLNPFPNNKATLQVSISPINPDKMKKCNHHHHFLHRFSVTLHKMVYNCVRYISSTSSYA